LTDGWRVLTARVPEAVDDEIAAVLGEGSLGVEVSPSGPGMSDVRVYLAASDDADGWRDRAASVLAAHGLTQEGAALAMDPVEDGRWVERWQASLAPIPLGARFVVVPTGHAVAADGRDAIRLIPGMAFGTGEHETTRLAAASLERHTVPGSRWLDLGTGTGLLAVVAARCGASRVLALDLDPEAARVASEVVRANGASGIVDVRAGSIDLAGGERFDGIVANIQSSFFLSEAGRLAQALRPGGVLIASGFLDGDLVDIDGALSAAGIDVSEQSQDGPWVCLLARRRDA
jgi:ribosomal protein L11 methyltransferase